MPTHEDKELIADFILNWSNDSQDGMPMSPNTKRSYIDALVALSRYYKYKKSFKQITREDIVDGYSRSLKKDISQDPDQKWVNTHNLKGSKYLSFWKWLTQPEIRREERQTPPQMKGLESYNTQDKDKRQKGRPVDCSRASSVPTAV